MLRDYACLFKNSTPVYLKRMNRKLEKQRKKKEKEERKRLVSLAYRIGGVVQ